MEITKKQEKILKNVIGMLYLILGITYGWRTYHQIVFKAGFLIHYGSIGLVYLLIGISYLIKYNAKINNDE
ncbi:hypothetical protein CPAV1605_812 [seawater metagenome]|uniref:Uncharacterized protein n=1 Tax=seawater metagenome TaxID=1561972 RepID=A0A5E8CJ03_9ZZZZ